MAISYVGRNLRLHAPLMLAAALGLVCLPGFARFAQAQDQALAQEVVHKIHLPNERMELIVNTSRIITLDEPLPKLQVANPELLTVTPLAPNEVQIAAKKTGVTQVNLWSQSGKIYTLDVMVTGDARELAMVLRTQFPNSSLKVMPLPNSVIISGNVDDATQVNQIIDIADDYYPKVHNQIVVGGVQQVLLQVRLMEVSRTKLRNLGVDFADLASNGSFVASGIDGLLKMAAVPTKTITTTGGETFSYGIMGPGNSFFMFLEALRSDQLAKILAEPNLVTVSGRPAYFNVGGEIPIPVPQSLGTVSIQYKPYGTQVDFVPIVLGNGAIRLEVRPRVSEIDDTRSVVINNINVPALKVREIDTGVEMRPGQTLAIAGLVQNRVDSLRRTLPFVGDMPYIGALFRKVNDQINEVELLVLVTPQLIEAMDPHEVPYCGPGMNTTNPTDVELYLKGYLEVPKLCPPGMGGPMGPGIAPIGPGPIGPMGMSPEFDGASPPPTMSAPSSGPGPVAPTPPMPSANPSARREPTLARPQPGSVSAAARESNSDIEPAIDPPAPIVARTVSGTQLPPASPSPTATPSAVAIPSTVTTLPPVAAPSPVLPAPAVQSPSRIAVRTPVAPESPVMPEAPAATEAPAAAPPKAIQPTAVKRQPIKVALNRNNPENRIERPTPPEASAAKNPRAPGFIGPVGYDVLK